MNGSSEADDVMAESGTGSTGTGSRRERGGGVPPRAPLTHRLLLRVWPRWFTDEYGGDLVRHLACQRAEARYAVPVVGGLRFWWDAGMDALRSSVALRLSRLREPRRTAGRDGARFGVHGQPEGRLATMLEALFRDVRHALRALGRNPGYAAVFIVTLGLGIGANTAMFSAVNGVLLRPLPYEGGDRLVYLRHSARPVGIENALFSVPEIDDYRQAASSLEAVAEFSALDFTMLGHETPRRVRAGIVTGNYFAVMGQSALIGRTVGPEDDGETAPAVIVLSHAYWQNTFGGDPGVIGMTLQMNGRSATIVGVAEPAPPYPERTDIYVNMAASPHHLDASMNHDRTHRMTEVFARMAPGATVEAVRRETAVITSRVHADHPESYDASAGFDVSVTPLKTQLTARARPTLLLALGTSFLVLIIACANLANLTLTRVIRRSHELAVRVSLGGSRRALRRGLLMESMVLTIAGAGLGLLIASVSIDVLVRFAGRFTSRASEITLDATVFGFALLAAVVASVFFTILPPLPSGQAGGMGLTRSGGRTTVGSSARRAQRALVVAQIATSFVLLIGAGLLLRTMINLYRIDPGFDTAQVLSMNIPSTFGTQPEADLRNMYLGILGEVQALPGVESAALTSDVPLRGGGIFTGQTEMTVEGHVPAPGAPRPMADFRVVSAGFFETMGIDVLRGRGFTTTDTEAGAKVVIINAALARDYFGSRNPIGRRIAWTDPNLRFVGMSDEWRTVVGVVADTRDSGLDAAVVHTMYNPYHQVTPYYTGSLVVRVNGDPMAVMPGIRAAVLAHDPQQPIDRVATIADLRDESVAPQRLNTLLLGGFALLALIIAAVGIGGVLAFSVGSRTREFGVRSALGAVRHQIWSGVLAEGALLAVAGVVLGAAIATALTRFVAGLLVGVPALDPVTFIAVAVLLAGVALLASWVPAWRAASVSPVEALSAE